MSEMGDDAPKRPSPRPVRRRPTAIVVPVRKPAPIVVEGWAPPTDSVCAPNSYSAPKAASEGWAPPSDCYSMPGMVGMNEGGTFVDPEARDDPAAAARSARGGRDDAPAPTATGTTPARRRSYKWVQDWGVGRGSAAQTPGATPATTLSGRSGRATRSKRDETSNLREAVDAFRARERALLAQIETQKAAFDAREAALRFQLSEAARREAELRADFLQSSARERALLARLTELSERTPLPSGATTPSFLPTRSGATTPRGDFGSRSKWDRGVGEDLAKARESPAGSRPRSLRDLEASFKDKGSPFRSQNPTPPRTPEQGRAPSRASSRGDLRGFAIPRPPGDPIPADDPPKASPVSPPASPVVQSRRTPASPRAVEPGVERAVSHLIEKDRARDGDVQRMLEMVANLQSEMADLKAENERRPVQEDSKAGPPDSTSPTASHLGGAGSGATSPDSQKRGSWSLF